MLLQTATKDNACQLENGWESTLAPTTNQVAPRMDFVNLLWESVINKVVNPAKCKSMALRVNTLLNAQANIVSASDMCHLVLISKGYVNAQQFEKLWRRCTQLVREEYGIQVPRRLVVPMPPLTDPVKLQVKQMVTGLINKTTLPRRVQRLLESSITCAPGTVTRVGDLIRGGRQLQAPSWEQIHCSVEHITRLSHGKGWKDMWDMS